MATKIRINGKLTAIPGIYTEIKSGIKNPSLQLSYGNICIIDTGMGTGFSALPGVNGQQLNGIDSVFDFTSLSDFRSYVRGGVYWKLAQNLFSPSGSVQGISKLYYIRAADTTPAQSTTLFGLKELRITTKDEGTTANTRLLGGTGKLVQGWACKIVKSTFNTNTFKLNIYLGSYTGLDLQDGNNNTPWDGVTEALSEPQLVLTSPEFTSLQSLKDWADNSQDFSSLFSMSLVSGGEPLTNTITDTEFTTLGSGLLPFIGGTETYSTAAYDRVLNEIEELDNTFFLAPDFGATAFSVNNTKLFYHINNEARFEKFMVVGGGFNRTEFSSVSVEVARSYNSDKVIIVHGGYREASSITRSLATRNSLHKAATVLGRICGLEPQTPLTFKSFSWLQEIHSLTKDEKEYALEKGVLCTIRDSELGFVCLQGINTLQRNNYLLNEDASSYSIAVKRIVAQLNKEITINAKLRFFGSEVGFNRGTATSQDIEAWLYTFLQQRVATTNTDNLIISFKDIVVELENDCYKVSYKFVPNFEVNKMIFTGVVIEN